MQKAGGENKQDACQLPPPTEFLCVTLTGLELTHSVGQAGLELTEIKFACFCLPPECLKAGGNTTHGLKAGGNTTHHIPGT